MGKGKPRHNPDKKQNKYGSWCQACDNGLSKVSDNQYFDPISQSYCTCEDMIGDVNICKGNRHNCIKTKYHRLASRSNIQIQNGVYS